MLLELLEHLVEFIAQRVVERLLLPNALQQAGLAGVKEIIEGALEGAALAGGQVVHVAVGAGEDDDDLFFHRQRRELVLLEQLGQARAAVELRQRGLVEVGAELCKGSQLAVLRQLQPQRACHLLHGLNLGVAAHAADRKADVDGRADAAVEEVGFQINLAVGDGDDVGGDVGGDVAGLGFDHRQGGERAPALFGAEFGGALQQARVQVEDVAREGFASRRPAQQQGNFAVGDGVLGEVVVEADRVAAGVAEVFADGAAGVGSDVLHGGGLGGGSDDHHGVVHGAGVFERLHHLGDGGALLADGDVDANDVAAFLVEDGVEDDGGFSGLAVADDQLALAAADGNHAVYGLDAGLERLAHGLALDHARRQAFERVELLGHDRALAIHRLPERVDHAPDNGFAHRH